MATITGGVYAKELTDLLGIGVTLNADGSVASVTGPTIRRVTADPNGVVSANAGSLALRTNGLLYICAGGTTWAQAAPSPAGDLVAMRAALTTASAGFAASTSTEQKFTAFQPTIANGALTAGTLLRIRIAGTINNGTGANVGLSVYGNDALTGLLAQTSLTNPANGAKFVLESTATIRAVPPGDVFYSQLAIVNTNAGVVTNLSNPFLAGQGAAITFTVLWNAANAGNSVDIEQFVVEVATN